MKSAAFGLFLLAFAYGSGAHSAIYRCMSDEGLVFSDRPCAAGAEAHEIDDSRVTVYDAPAVTTARSGTASNRTARSDAPRSKARRAKAAGGAESAEKHKAKCAKLEQGLRDVRTKMRTGYGAKEGERLKTRQRKLNEQRRTQKCR